MSDFEHCWSLSRKRFLNEISGLSQLQLNWRLHPGALTIGEMALHLAGVEVLFGSQIASTDLDVTGMRLRRAATDGVVNEETFPFEPHEITCEVLTESFEFSRQIWEPLIAAAGPATRDASIKTVLGLMISGEGALARIAIHAAYHHGQAYLVKNSPGFPQSYSRGETT